MSNSTNLTNVETLSGTKFNSFIKTDILLKDGKYTQITTLLADTAMFDEVFMGISRALKGGGKAMKWQSQLFLISNGVLKPSSKTAVTEI